MEKKKNRWWVWLLVAAYIAFIFYNSLQTAVVSDDRSLAIAAWLEPRLNSRGILISTAMLNHYVRKLAHFSEFFGLGLLVTAALFTAPVFRLRFLNFLIFVLSIPFADETIQRFVAGRSSQFSDMVIDGSGMLAGGLFCYLLILVIRDIFRRRSGS
jgi:VanZ family protein